MFKLVEGDLFDTDAQYIAHQCNCVSRYANGLASEIFTRYTHVYKERKEPSVPGSILVTDNFIIHMFAQVFPGPPRENPKYRDDRLWRTGYFAQCLSLIANIGDIRSVAFPYKIGCGHWEDYHALLKNFSLVSEIDTYIYRRTEDEQETNA